MALGTLTPSCVALSPTQGPLHRFTSCKDLCHGLAPRAPVQASCCRPLQPDASPEKRLVQVANASRTPSGPNATQQPRCQLHLPRCQRRRCGEHPMHSQSGSGLCDRAPRVAQLSDASPWMSGYGMILVSMSSILGCCCMVCEGVLVVEAWCLNRGCVNRT